MHILIAPANNKSADFFHWFYNYPVFDVTCNTCILELTRTIITVEYTYFATTFYQSYKSKDKLE